MTNDELWSQIRQGIRPNIAQEWARDHGATLQKIVEVVAKIKIHDLPPYRDVEAIRLVHRIIEEDILKPCAEYESEPGAFDSDIPPNDKGARL